MTPVRFWGRHSPVDHAFQVRADWLVRNRPYEGQYHFSGFGIYRMRAELSACVHSSETTRIRFLAKISSVPGIVGSVYCLGERIELLDINAYLNEESSAERPEPSGSNPYVYKGWDAPTLLAAQR